MIGNDVVDLRDPDSRVETHHARFDDRVFDETERAVIAASVQGDRVRWFLWAAKESAYKAARKEDPRVVFAPSRFAVRLRAPTHAVVTAGDRRFHVELTADAECVHAVAHTADDPRAVIWSAVAPLLPDAAASAAVRRLAVEAVARTLGVETKEVVIRQNRHIPTLRLRGRSGGVDVSLSHHGRFVAFAYALPPRGSLA